MKVLNFIRENVQIDNKTENKMYVLRRPVPFSFLKPQFICMISFILTRRFITSWGLLRTEWKTSWLRVKSTAPESQRSWVQIPCLKFFRAFFSLLFRKYLLLWKSVPYSFLKPQFTHMVFTYSWCHSFAVFTIGFIRFFFLVLSLFLLLLCVAFFVMPW